MESHLSWDADGVDWPNREASRFVEASGYRWHVQIMGEGPVALLLHGTGAATHSWRALMPVLARHFTVVAPDLPGHGFTQSAGAAARLSLVGMARDIAGLCRALDIEPRLAVGHSAGAAILARMTLDRLIAPKLIVSLNGAFLPFDGLAAVVFSPLAKALASNSLMPRLFARCGGDPASVHRLLAGTGSVIDAEGEQLYGRLVSSPAHVAAAMQMMANWDLHPLMRDLPELPCDLLLVAAVNDRSVPPDVARRVKKLVPRATLAIVPLYGHLAHEEAPDRIGGLILEAAAARDIVPSETVMSS